MRSQAENLETQRNKVDRNAPITCKHVFPKRSAKMIDGTEKLKMPSKFAKHAARYKEFGYNMDLMFQREQCYQTITGHYCWSVNVFQSPVNSLLLSNFVYQARRSCASHHKARCHSDMGIPIPKTLVIWAPPSRITLAI